MNNIDALFNWIQRFFSFAKNIGTNLSNKYSQKLLDSATGDLTGNKIADKIAKSSTVLHSKTDEDEIEIPKKKYISRKKTTNYWWTRISIII